MDYLLFFQAFLQGIVEGATEFLPVSSTGHMIIVDTFFPMRDEVFAKRFEVVIQLGAIASVLVYFYKTLLPQKYTITGVREMFPLWGRVLAGVIPAGVIGLLLDDFIESNLFNITVVSIALVVWGIALVFSRKLEIKNTETMQIAQISYGKVIAIGFFQCLAMIPGTSRSAVTILGAMCLGCSRSCAAEFSFFLAIPTMFGASLLTLLKGGASMDMAQWIALAIGFVTAFFVAWGVIAWFIGYVRKHDFLFFGWYRIVLGTVLILLQLSGVMGGRH